MAGHEDEKRQDATTDYSRFAPPGMAAAETPSHAIPVFDAPPQPPEQATSEPVPGANSVPATPPSPEPTPSYSWQSGESSADKKTTGLSEFQQPIEAIKFSPDVEDDTTRRNVKDMVRGLGKARWFGYTRNTIAVVSGVVTVLALIAWSVLSGAWVTFVQPANYSAVAFEAYEEEALQDQIAQAILAAIWEQYPPEVLAEMLNSELYSPDAYERLPEEFHDYVWNFNTPAQIEQLMSSWLPPYVKERVAASESKSAWMEANTSVHTTMIDTLEGATNNARDLIDIDLGSFRDTWMTESTGVPLMDDLIEKLDLNVSFVDAYLVEDLKTTYQSGKMLRLILPVVAGLAFAIGLASARRRPWLLVGVGTGLLAAWALAEPIGQLPTRYFAGDDDSIGAIVLHQGLVVQSAESARFLMYLGIAGGILLLFGLLFGAMVRRRTRKAAELLARDEKDTADARSDIELVNAR
jgi:hypothetical protein